ncbi:MAG TPA: LysR family transcriptional regulator [Steroidobacteraceae bacterium]|jgi:DNA-binding transcriptional LysR family regulator|nr:LysR family transcriptional regulator [Steroidobacteraceae bacterium]
MALDPRQLRAFIAIVRTGSLGLAADSLHVTQPALSRIIRRLEMQLGVPLFERRTTGMELTSFGHALLPHATFLSEEAALALEQINSLRGLGQGTIRIGAVGSVAISVLPAVLDHVLTQWPNLHVQIVEAVEDLLTQQLTNNAIDVAICGSIPESEEIVQVAEHKFTDRYSVICSASNELQHRTDLTIHDIIDVPWVMPAAEAEPRRMFSALISRLGVSMPRIVVETRSPTVIKALVAKTHFLGWLPEPLFAADAAAGLIRALKVKEMAPQRRFFVFRRRRNFMPPPVVKFLEALKTVEL